MKKFLILLLTVFSFNSCTENSRANQYSTEQEIRSVLCQIENGDYVAAQNNLEKILQKELQNIYAQRLLPGTLAHQIKENDKSAENIAQIRKAIEAYERFLQNPQISTKEKAQADDVIIRLYEKISEEEQARELLERIADIGRTPEERSSFLTTLATRSNKCANELIWEKTKPEKSEIEKAKICASKGLEYINQAITLDGNSDAAWSYKASLLSLASKIADLENDHIQKNSLQKQYEEAVRRFKEISKKRLELLNKEDEERDKQTPFEETTLQTEDLSQELIEYQAENPLNELVSDLYIPSNSHLMELIAPIEPDEKSDINHEVTLKNSDNQKRELKEFSPADEEIVAELPDNVSFDQFGESLVYQADSEGIRYLIFSQPRPSFQTSDDDEAVLNTLAWSIVKPLSNFWLMGNTPNSYEIRLLRKETLNGRPGRIYALTLGSCSRKTEGLLIVVVGRERNYGIEIRGANEQDSRVQRFLKSFKFTAQS
jgi:hypothetical protein